MFDSRQKTRKDSSHKVHTLYISHVFPFRKILWADMFDSGQKTTKDLSRKVHIYPLYISHVSPSRKYSDMSDSRQRFVSQSNLKLESHESKEMVVKTKKFRTLKLLSCQSRKIDYWKYFFLGLTHPQSGFQLCEKFKEWSRRYLDTKILLESLPFQLNH